MRKHIWFVIEGDNGAGKDTLADRLLPDGWFLASRSPHVVTAKEQASHLTGVDRVDAFLLYNQMCAKLATKHPSRSFLVRYWPSTLAAGFADAILEWAEFETRLDQCVRQLPTPELILFLQCGLDARHNRVQQRGIVPESVDDISATRNFRYLKAIMWMTKYPELACWKTLDTSDLNIEQVHQAVQLLLAEME